jgi:hypothetical protein
MDGKALIVKGNNQEQPITKEERRCILTMSYTVTGRLLLTESFSRFDDEVIHDISRVFPFHATDLSARPTDAFIQEIPGVFSFAINPGWHQVVLYNSDSESSNTMNIPLSGSQFLGAIGLNQDKKYHIYDFWNDTYRGIFHGNDTLSQSLRKGEARMLSIHEQKNYPQFISTDRHIMQGYVDMIEYPEWDNAKMELSGRSSIIGGEPYTVIIALNKFIPMSVKADGAACKMQVIGENQDFVRLVVNSSENKVVRWILRCDKSKD